MKLSATIITRNEEKNIADCLASLSFVDEIVVVDSGSSDRTEEICRAHPQVRFFHQDWQGYGAQKNIAARLALHNWVLNVDADERVSPALRQAIEQADYAGHSGFRMTRRNFFGRRWIRHCGWYPDYTLRLYDKTACAFSERPVHEAVICDGQVGQLAGDLLHFTYDGIADYLQRMDRYSTLAAQELHNKGHRVSMAALVLRPAATFVKMFLLKKGFLEGCDGLVLSALYACYTFCKYAKAREMTQETKNG